MKTILSALLAASVLASVASAAKAEEPKFGSHDWWAQQDANRN